MIWGNIDPQGILKLGDFEFRKYWIQGILNLGNIDSGTRVWIVISRREIIFFLFFTCSPSRDYIDFPTSKSQVPKAFLCWTCYPPSRLNLVTSWVLYFSPLSVPILLAGIQKQSQCKVSCSGTQYSSYFCKAVTHSESDQARRCLPSLTRLNAHTRSTPLYHFLTRLNAHTRSTPLYQINLVSIDQIGGSLSENDWNFCVPKYDNSYNQSKLLTIFYEIFTEVVSVQNS